MSEETRTHLRGHLERRVDGDGGARGRRGLGLLQVPVAEQKLARQVGLLDDVVVRQSHLAAVRRHAHQREVLQQLAPASPPFALHSLSHRVAQLQTAESYATECKREHCPPASLCNRALTYATQEKGAGSHPSAPAPTTNVFSLVSLACAVRPITATCHTALARAHTTPSASDRRRSSRW